MESTGEESDQLPEEAPSEQVVDDDGEESSRRGAEQPRGGPGQEPGQASGHPDNAG